MLALIVLDPDEGRVLARYFSILKGWMLQWLFALVEYLDSSKCKMKFVVRAV